MDPAAMNGHDPRRAGPAPASGAPLTSLPPTAAALEVPPPLTATGPLGCCYQCVTTRQKDPAKQVAQAITLAPTTVQITDAIGNVIGIQIVALPHCQACMSGTSSRLIT
jgi:hypothetical protein